MRSGAIATRSSNPAAYSRSCATELEKSGRYQFLPGREVREVRTGEVRDDHGEIHAADEIFL